MFNLVVLTGRLTADPELKTTPTGVNVTSSSIAVSRRYRSGEETQADFINIVAWRQTAEFISKHFQKGTRIAVVGSIQTRSWEDNEGHKRKAVEVVADSVYFADAKKDAEAGSYAANAYASGGFEELGPDEEIPF